MRHIVVPEGSFASISREAGLIYAAMDEIYPIVAKFASGAYESHKKAMLLLRLKIRTIVQRFKYVDSDVYCDETLNPPSLATEGKLRVKILLRPLSVAAFTGGVFTLGIERNSEDDPGHLSVAFKDAFYAPAVNDERQASLIKLKNALELAKSSGLMDDLADNLPRDLPPLSAICSAIDRIDALNRLEQATSDASEGKVEEESPPESLS